MRSTTIHCRVAEDADLTEVADALAILAQASVTIGGSNSVVKFSPLTQYHLNPETGALVMVIQHS